MKPNRQKLPGALFIGAVVFVLFSTTTIKAQICSVNAGLDKTICITQPLSLVGSVGNGQSSPPVYSWTKLAGPPANITSPAALTTTVTGLTPGNYVFQFSNKCIDGLIAKDIVSITILPEPPTAIAGPDMNFCYNVPVHLSANAASAPYIGTWTVSPVGGTFSPNANDPNAVYTILPTPGIRKFTWTISNGVCQKSDLMQVSFSEPVSPISAGPNDTLSCKGGCATLNASYPGFAPQNGLWTIISGPNTPTFSNPASSSSKVCNLVPGNYIFRWTVSGSCIHGSDDMMLHVINIKSPPISLGDQAYTDFCEDPAVSSEVLMGGPIAIGDSVTWTQVGGGSIATFSPDNHHASVLVGNMTGTFPYKFIYTQTGASGCVVATTHTVYRSQLITGLTDPPDQELPCNVTGTTFNISFNKLNTISNSVVRRAVFVSGPIDSGRVEFTSSAVSGLTRTDTWRVSNLMVPGTYIYSMEYSNACGTSFQDISIIVSGTPGKVNAGSDIFLPCQSLSVSPVGSANAPGISTWTQVSGPGTALITGQNTLDPDLSGMIQGVYTIRLSNWGGNACPIKSDDMNITVTQLPPLTATIAADTAICAGNYQLTANTPLLTETGTWTVMPAGISFYPDEHTPNAFISGLDPNSIYSFTWTVSNTCGSLFATQILTTGSFFSAPIPNAGNDICETEGTITVPLNGNDPSGANILWTALTAGSEIQPANQQNTQAAFSNGSGVYFFQYALSTPGCATLKDTIQITIKSNIIINAGLDINICSPIIPCSTTLNATSTTSLLAVDAIWTQLSGPSNAVITFPADPNTSITGLQPGIYEFEYRMIPTNDCEYIADTVFVNVTAEPSDALAGPDQSVCSITPGTVITLAANTPDVGSGYWQMISGPQGSSTPVFSDQQISTAGISNLSQGTYHLLWTVTNGTGCSQKTDAMVIDVSAAAIAGPDLVGCSSTNIQLTGSPNTNGIWTFISGPIDVNISANSGNTAIVSGFTTTSSPAVYTFRYSLPDIGACPGSSDDLVFTDYPPPSQANAGGDKVLCFDETTVTLTGNNPLVGKGNWIWQSGPNSPSPGLGNNVSNDTIINNLIPGVYVYQYRVSTNPACATSTGSIQIIKQAKANAQTDFRVCNVLSVNLNANVPLLGQGTWSYVSGPLAPGSIIFSNINNPATSVTGLVAGTYIFRWSLPTAAGCAPNYDDIQVIIDPAVPVVNAGTDRSFCQGTTTSFAIGSNANPGVTYSWTPTVLLSNSTIAQPLFQGVNNAGNYIYTLKANIGSCETFSTIHIDVKPTPFANIEIIDAGCTGNFMASSPGTGVNNPVYSWNFGFNVNPAVASGAGPHFVIFNSAATRNITLLITSSDGCSNSTSLNYSPYCVLSVKLTSFEAVWKKDYAEISWEVENAINLSHFELQRSENGIEFSKLQETLYINDQKKYIYPDRALNSSINSEVFYRLKMIDIDHNFTYSPVKTIKFSHDAGINVWPNPFNDKIRIAYNSLYLSENTYIRIYNSIGEIVVNARLNFSQGNNFKEINNLGNLAPGLYILQIISEGRMISNNRIIKRFF